MRRCSLILLVLLSARCWGIEFAKSKVVPPNTWVEIAVDSPCLWKAASPLDLDVRNYAKLKSDGNVDMYVGVLWSGKGGRKLYVDEIRNGVKFPEYRRHVITVGKSPGPEPEPEPEPPGPEPVPPPDLSTYAKQVYDVAAKVNQPAVAGKIADVYGGVASAIAAGGIRDLSAAKDAITSGMKSLGPLDRKWQPLGALVLKSFNKSAQNLELTKKMCADVAAGLYAAAGEKSAATTMSNIQFVQLRGNMRTTWNTMGWSF